MSRYGYIDQKWEREGGFLSPVPGHTIHPGFRMIWRNTQTSIPSLLPVRILL